MSTKVTKNTRSSILKIGANLTIDNIGDFQTKLLKALQQKRPIKVKSDIIESIDLPGIQLLVLLKESVENKKITSIDTNFSENTKELITKCGFTELLSL